MPFNQQDLKKIDIDTILESEIAIIIGLKMMVETGLDLFEYFIYFNKMEDFRSKLQIQ